jgi:hypothetical protein
MNIVLSEHQLKLLVEDYKSDMEKRLQAAGKKSTVGKKTCPSGYKLMTQREMSAYSQQIVKPWRDTTRGDKSYITLPNGSVCKSFRSEKFDQYMKSVSLDSFMEDMRSFMTSGEGAIIQIMLDFTGGGKIINLASWALLALYDIIKGVKQNVWNYGNILIDLAGVAFSSAGSQFLKNSLKNVGSAAAGKLSTFVANVAKKAPQAYSYISKVIRAFGTITSKISSSVTSFITFIGKYIKGTSLYKGLMNLKNTITSTLGKILDWIESSFGQTAGQYAQKTVTHGRQVAGSMTGEKVQDYTIDAAAKELNPKTTQRRA